MPELNDWDVPYSVIQFFCRALGGHDKVDSYNRIKDILFIITLKNGKVIKVLLVNEYALGLAAVLRARKEFHEAEYIVTGGNWNGYTPEAKDYGTKNSIGIFNVGEFFGALNWTDPKKYYKKNKHGDPVYSYKSA
ncbi:conserved hypothetical protein [Syntrophobacter sp. SbD1]|nr:conserved hypothetical protein [Syntrophobacter sp. SbD1]